MTLVISRLRKYRLGEYNTNQPIVFVEANDPDGACFKAVHKLIRMILDQDDSAKARLLCKDIKPDIRIIKAAVKI